MWPGVGGCPVDYRLHIASCMHPSGRPPTLYPLLPPLPPPHPPLPPPVLEDTDVTRCRWCGWWWSMMMVVVVLMIVWFWVFLFCLLFFSSVPKRGNAPLIIGIFLVFFSSALSARITSDTGCFRNMAGSWGKVSAKACRVRNPSSSHLRSMSAGGTAPQSGHCLSPSHLQVVFLVYFNLYQQLLFSLSLSLWYLPFCVCKFDF